MRQPQRLILLITGIAIAAMLICPPWLHTSESGMNIFHEPYSFGEFSLGYHFIFLPPRMARINIPLLLLQIGGVGLVGALVSLATRQTK